jgi:hypothetical protein
MVLAFIRKIDESPPVMKNQYLIYKVTSDAFSGLKHEFTTKKEAVAYARTQHRDGWWAKVTDMRAGKVLLELSPK